MRIASVVSFFRAILLFYLVSYFVTQFSFLLFTRSNGARDLYLDIFFFLSRTQKENAEYYLTYDDSGRSKIK